MLLLVLWAAVLWAPALVCAALVLWFWLELAAEVVAEELAAVVVAEELAGVVVAAAPEAVAQPTVVGKSLTPKPLQSCRGAGSG